MTKDNLETRLSAVRTSPKRTIQRSTSKILTLDIENSPNLSYVWDVWRDKVGVGKLKEHNEVMCWAAKWYHKKPVMFASNFHDGHDAMIAKMWDLLDEADIVVTYNGVSFDTPRLNGEFLLARSGPPSPYKNIDLYRTVKSKFDFPSSSLNYISNRLEIGSKVDTGGFQLWLDCMLGDPAAWARMKKYNINDVKMTEVLYDELRPWINAHPIVNVAEDVTELQCPRCGSTDLVETEKSYRAVMFEYPQFQCQNCGGYAKGKGGQRITHMTSVS